MAWRSHDQRGEAQHCAREFTILLSERSFSHLIHAHRLSWSWGDYGALPPQFGGRRANDVAAHAEAWI